MASTDARPGFRLPWGSDRSDTGETADTTTQDEGAEAPTAEHESETPAMTEAASATTDTTAEATAEPVAAPEAMSSPDPVTPPPAPRKPSKFMADLTKAMQAAAEAARAET